MMRPEKVYISGKISGLPETDRPRLNINPRPRQPAIRQASKFERMLKEQMRDEMTDNGGQHGKT